MLTDLPGLYVSLIQTKLHCSGCVDFCHCVQEFDISDIESFVVTTTNREEIKNDVTYSKLLI